MAINKHEDQHPRVEPLALGALAEGYASELEAGAHLESLRFDGASHRLTGDVLDLTGASLIECELVGLTAVEVQLRGARLSETRVEQLNAPTLKGLRSVWREVEIVSSRAGAVDLYDAELDRVVVSGSKLGWVSLHAAKLQDVEFRSCQIDELDLTGASLERCAFHEVTVKKLVLRDARAAGLDLRGLSVRQLDCVEGLRGATISQTQLIEIAELFAAHLGVRVAD